MDSLHHQHAKVLPGGRLSRKDAAAYLGRSAQTLAGWATVGRGPRPINIGGRAFYNLTDLDAFIDDGNR